jgi:cytochrome b561
VARSWRNSARAYGIVALVFHWLVAAMIFIQIGIGWYASDLPLSMARLRWMSWHKSVGITILALILLRAAWRFTDRPPPLPDTIPTTERRLASLAHWALYALLVLTPLAGWLTASAKGLTVNWFGQVLIPNLIAKDAEFGEILRDVHQILVWTLAGLITIHILAALRHGMRRDGILARMLPFVGPASGERQ